MSLNSRLPCLDLFIVKNQKRAPPGVALPTCRLPQVADGEVERATKHCDQCFSKNRSRESGSQGWSQGDKKEACNKKIVKYSIKCSMQVVCPQGCHGMRFCGTVRYTAVYGIYGILWRFSNGMRFYSTVRYQTKYRGIRYLRYLAPFFHAQNKSKQIK